MSKKIELFLEEELEVCCSVTKAFKGTMETPPEPSEIEDLYVGVIIKGRSIDITSLLDKKQITYFEEQVWELLKENEED